MRSYNGNIFKTQLAIFHQNLVGKKNAKDTIISTEILISKLLPDILVISEADTEVITSWHYPGYTAYKGQLLGGGDLCRVSAIVRNSIPHTITYLDCEVPHVVVNLNIDNRRYRVTGIYREWNYSAKPSTRQEQEARWTIFEDAWFRDNRRCKHSCLIGDMNFCYAGNGSTHQQSMENLRSSVMDNIVLRGWTQLITKPTRYQGTQVPSCLDHIYYNNVDQVKYSVNKAYSPGDHNCTGFVIKTKRFIPAGDEFKSRCWGKVNWTWGRYLTKYSSHLFKIFGLKDPNDILDTIEVELHTIMDTIAPEQLVKIKPGSQRWMTTHIKSCLEYRDKLKEVWIQSGLRSDERKWKEARTEVRFKVRRAKEKQVEADLEVKDLKKRWQKIKTIVGGESNSGPPSELVEDGVTHKEPVDIANILQRGFGGKVEGIMQRVKMDPDKAMILFEDYAKKLEEKQKFGTFEFQEVDCRDVRRACMSLNNTASLGTDGIPTIVIKELSRELAPYLAYLINQIFRTGIFPERWRQGIVCPIFKSGDRKNKLNYRPVTVTNSLSKVWERIANNQMNYYYWRYNVIDRSQHAYQRGKGCDTYWADLVTKICWAKDNGKKALLQCYDLSAAFNLCQAEIIRPKMARIGFTKKAIDMVLQTMTRRRLIVKIGDAFSEVRETSIGSGEGGIISPSLFNFTLCDVAAIKYRMEAAAKAGIRTEQAMLAVEAGEKTLEETAGDLIKVDSLENEPGGYADDNAFVNMTNTEEELRAVAFENNRQVMEYFEVNGMAANSSKSEIISLANRFAAPVIVAGVKSQQVVKLLGLRMDSKLSFMAQAHEVVRKVMNKLPSVVRLREWASKELLIRTADSLLLSHFRYLLNIFAGEHRVQVMLQRCQNKVMRALLGHQLTDRVSVRDMLAELGWDSVPNMVRYRTLFWIRKVDREACAPYMWKHLDTGFNTRYDTRKWRLNIDIIPRTLVTAGLFPHRGLQLYNAFNLWPLCLDFHPDFKEHIHDLIISKWPNGNI